MITKKFGVDFHSYGGALTLQPNEVSTYPHQDYYNRVEKLHDDGWKISGIIKDDYYEWVNEFDAFHPEYGKVWGNFEHEVYSDSEEGFQHFYKNHKPLAWDYGDI